MHTERLQHLITILEKVPRQAFDMSAWSAACGTVCCAAGWAALDPVFNEQGFHMSAGFPEFGHSLGWIYPWESIRTFFELSREQALHLFSEGSYFCDDLALPVTPQHVIDRIKTLLETP